VIDAVAGAQLFFQEGGIGIEQRPYSEFTAQAMDEEAKKLVDEAYSRTLKLLQDKKSQVEAIAELLLQKETINHDDIVGTIGSRPFTNHKQYQEFIDSTKKQEPGAATNEDSSSGTNGKEKEPELPAGLSPA